VKILVSFWYESGEFPWKRHQYGLIWAEMLVLGNGTEEYTRLELQKRFGKFGNISIRWFEKTNEDLRTNEPGAFQNTQSHLRTSLKRRKTERNGPKKRIYSFHDWTRRRKKRSKLVIPYDIKLTRLTDFLIKSHTNSQTKDDWFIQSN